MQLIANVIALDCNLLGDSLKITDGFSIVSKDFISNIIGESQLQNVLGLEYLEFKQSKYYVLFTNISIDEVRNDSVNKGNTVRKIDLFFLALWFIKHYRANFQYVVVVGETSQIGRMHGTQDKICVHANDLGGYTFDEVNRAKEIYPKIVEYFFEKGLIESRLQLFLYFIRKAISDRDIRVNILMLALALETLLCGDNSAISHKVAERVVAINYKDTPVENKYSRYRSIKQAYDMRSEIVHNASIVGMDKLEKLQSSSNILIEECTQLLMNTIEDKELESLFRIANSKEFNFLMIKRCL